MFRNSEGYYDPTAGEAIKNAMESGNDREVKRGDIFLIDNKNPENGEKYGYLVISRENDGEESVVTVNLRVTKYKNPCSAMLMGKVPMSAMYREIRTTNKKDLTEYVRSATDKEMEQIDRCIMEAVLPEVKITKPQKEKKPEANEESIRLKMERDFYKDLYEKTLERLIGKKEMDQIETMYKKFMEGLRTYAMQ